MHPAARPPSPGNSHQSLHSRRQQQCTLPRGPQALGAATKASTAACSNRSRRSMASRPWAQPPKPPWTSNSAPPLSHPAMGEGACASWARPAAGAATWSACQVVCVRGLVHRGQCRRQGRIPADSLQSEGGGV